ncbi:tape measure protein [Mycobacterium phage NoShow]|nr:tape measure protein [Mycobacterium phage NoShow]
MTAALGGGELATEWVTLLPETATLAKRLKQFKPAPIKVEVEADYDEVEREGQRSGRRTGQSIHGGVTRETRGTGTTAARQIASGLNDRAVHEAAERLGRSIRNEVENETRKISFKHIGSNLATGFGAAASGTMQIIRNIGTIAMVTRYAARAARGMSLSLLAGATAVRALTGAGLARFGMMLGFTAKQADRLAKQIARVTSAILVMTAAVKMLQFMHTASKWMGLLTVGGVALAGVLAGTTQLIAGPLYAALISLASGLGIAAGAAAGLLGPMLGVAKIGFKGMSEGIKVIQKEWKEVDEAFYKTVGERMRPMLESWHRLSNGITDSMSEALIPSFGNLGTLMDRLAPKSNMLARTFGDLGNEVTRSLLSPANSAALDKMFDASNRFFRSFLGESGISGALGGLVQFSATAADTFSGVGQGINDALLKFGEWLRGITPGQMKAVFEVIKVQIQNVMNVVKPLWNALRELAGISAPAMAPAFKAIGDAIKQATPGIMNMARILMPALSQVIQNLAPAIPALVQAFTPMAQILAVIAPPIADIVAKMAPFAPIILAVATAVKVATIALALYNTAMLVFTNLTKIARAVQWAFNAALAANPIGLVVAAIAAVVAGLTLFFTKTETGRKLWDKIWTGIKNTFNAVWNFIKVEGGKLWQSLKPQLESLGRTAADVFGKLKTAFQELWPKVQPVVQALAKAWLQIQKFNFTVVIAALKALGTAIGWWVTNVVVPGFKLLIAAAKQAWDNLKTIFAFIKGAWDILWFGIQVGWEIGKRVFEAVGNVLEFVWNTVLKPIFDALGAVWNFLVEKLQWFGSVWNTVWEGLKAAVQAVWDFLKPVRDFMGEMFQKIGDMGKAAGDAIKSAWSGLTSVLKAPLNALGRFLQGLPDSVFGIEIPFVGELKGWGASLAGLNTGGVIKGPGTGTSDSILGLNERGVPVARVSSGEGIVKARALESPLGRMLFNVLNNLPGYAGGGVPGGGDKLGLNPGAAWLADFIKKNYGITNIGGRRSEDGYGEHSSGNAMDIMTPSKAVGDKIAGFLLANKETLGLDGMIWQQRSYGYGGSWDGKYMSDRGSPTQNHMDHIHAILGKGRGVGAAAVGLPKGPIIDPVTNRNITGGSSGSLSAGDFSTYTGGTPLGGDGASAGYFQVDRKKVREAEDKVTDMTNQLDIKQKKLDEYLAKQAAGEKVNATTIEAARDAVDKQSRDLEQAKADLEEAKQGKYVEGRKPGKGSDGDSGGTGQESWNEVGKMIFSGFLESFGFDGSVLTNLFETPNVKSAMAGLNWGLGMLFPDQENAEAGAPQDLGMGTGGSGLATAGMDMLAGIGDQAGVNIAPHGDMAMAGATPGPGNAPVFDLRGSQLGVSPAAFEDKMGEMTAANRRHPTLGPN